MVHYGQSINYVQYYALTIPLCPSVRRVSLLSINSYHLLISVYAHSSPWVELKLTRLYTVGSGFYWAWPAHGSGNKQWNMFVANDKVVSAMTVPGVPLIQT